jgi:hypothetical protein
VRWDANGVSLLLMYVAGRRTGCGRVIFSIVILPVLSLVAYSAFAFNAAFWCGSRLDESGNMTVLFCIACTVNQRIKAALYDSFRHGHGASWGLSSTGPE